MEFLFIAAILVQDRTRDLLQDKTAEETFNKIEESIQKAKTLRITFKLEQVLKEGKADKIEKSGTFLLKQGNKANLRIKEKGSNTLLVSDGHLMKIIPKDVSALALETPKDLNANLLRRMLREGNAAPLLDVLGPLETTLPQTKQPTPASDFTFGEDKDGIRVLKYRVGAVGAQLRYDPKTLRVWGLILSDQESGRVIETFEEFELNATIPDDEFAVVPDNARD